MNFLAHIYLSGRNEELMLGNFIGDYVKGREHRQFSTFVENGILLHRKIDSFTDNHPIVLEHKKLFYNRYHKYAGIITDILYDHFLACEWQKFSDTNFDDYIKEIYDWLLANIANMPETMHEIVPRMIRHNWLNSYKTIDGIESVLIGMSKGTSLPAEHPFAIHIINKHYNELRHGFFEYFPQLISYTEEQPEFGHTL